MRCISIPGHSGSSEVGITSFMLSVLTFGFKVAFGTSRTRFSGVWVEKYNQTLVVGIYLLTVVFTGFIYLYIFFAKTH